MRPPATLFRTIRLIPPAFRQPSAAATGGGFTNSAGWQVGVVGYNVNRSINDDRASRT